MGLLERQRSRKKSYVMKLKLKEFTYPCDRVCRDGGCEAVVTARTRCGWANGMECGELLCGRRFPSKLKGVVHKSYVRPAILFSKLLQKGYKKTITEKCQ